MKEVILAQLSQLQLTVGKLVDAEKVGVELEVQKRALVEKQRRMAILHKQVGDLEAKCKKLEEDLTKMDKAWRIERLQLQGCYCASLEQEPRSLGAWEREVF